MSGTEKVMRNYFDKILSKLQTPIAAVIIFFIIPALLFYATQFIIYPVSEIKWKLQIVNIVFFEILAVFFMGITGRAKWALRIEIILTGFFSILNAYIYIFRGSYIMPWDIMSAKTAMNVAGNFSFLPNKRMVVGALICVLLPIAAKFTDVFKIKKNTVVKRLSLLLISAGCVISLYFGLQTESFRKLIGFHEGLFRIYVTTQNNGLFPGFIYKMKYLIVDKPDGYSAAAEKKILDETKINEEKSGDYPDIIVIMDEAFSDPAVDADFNVNEDYMPFIHSLEDNGENVITGYINTSVNGGNTPNTEFEFLTGNSMAFLPEGSIPYQSYVTRSIDNLAAYMNSLGFYSIAMHPYLASGWDRETVYPLFGFNESHFLDYFELFSPEYVRNYVSDSSLFKQIEYELENRSDKNRPVFSFNVSMQNHSDYDGDPENFERRILVDGLDEDDKYVKRLDNYLSLIRYTDDAFREMTEYYSNSGRKTIIVLFGDHQPSASVLRKIYELNGSDYENLSEEETLNLYRVPFVIWANYDIEEQSGIETSVNYLGNLVLKSAGIPLTRYRTFTEEFRERFPIISAIRFVNSEGDSLFSSQRENKLDDYAKMQYYELFDDRDDYE